MHQKHGAYYLVRKNKWHRLAGNLHDALVEYARLTAGPDNGALGELVSKTLADMKLTVAAGTLKNYTSCSRRVLESFAEFTPQQIKPHHVAQFLDDNKATPSMANLLRSFLKGMFQRAVRWGIVDANPVRDIEQFKTGKRDRYITADEYKSIRDKATPTLACLMDIAYITGQRMGDCRHIKYSDISDDGVFVRQQKTKARVLIAMTPDLAEVIARARALHQSVKGLTLFHRRDGTPIPYGTLYHQWSNACCNAKVKDAHFHDIRAAAATDAKAQGLDSKTLLGHTTESSHNRYLRSKETKVATPNRARKS
jgi:integrase